MAQYLIGDIQGCDVALQALLEKIAFSPSRDTLYALGDLVNRGPQSDAVLRRLMGYGSSAQCLLGNHDLHLLARAHGIRKPAPLDTLGGVLDAPDREAMLAWLVQQRMALHLRVGARELLMVHAGVLPTWTLSQTLALAAEVEQMLRSPQLPEFLGAMYGNSPNAWDAQLQGFERLRVVVNALTRLRFCSADGHMEFATKEGADAAPAGFMPWFDVPHRQTAECTIAFGHWSTLGLLQREDIIALDTGCVWGGCLSAVRIDVSTSNANANATATNLGYELIQVKCAASQTPAA